MIRSAGGYVIADGDRRRDDDMPVAGNSTDSQPDVDPTPPGSAAAPRQRLSVGARLLVAAAAVVLVLGAAAVAVIVVDSYRPGTAHDGDRDGDRGGDRGGDRDGGAGAASGEQVRTAPLAGRQAGTFVLADGLSSFDLRVADLGDDLYRISSPAGSGVAARPTVQGETVRLGLVETGASGTRAVRVLLNERVAWRLQLVGGVSGQVLDLTRARLLGVELAGGSTRTDLVLPAVSGGTMTVRLTGGTSQLDIRVPGTPPVRVRAGAGAGSVVVRDERWDGVAAGAVLGTPEWDRATDRIYLDMVAGAGAVTVSSSTR
ncbi:hypothetical protein GCM10011576_35510 [Micromonospora parathelypteridis]|nr:hypothetical protein GCM10011576_35510 [Micromonospora parathelypteridis]